MNPRKIYLLFVLFLSLNIYGQTGKGHFLLSGSSDFSFISATTSKEGTDQKHSKTYINFSPQAGYFIIDGLNIGVLADYNNNIKNKGPIDYSFSAGPFLRYYFVKSGKLLPFAQTDVAFGSNSYTFLSVSVTGDPNGEKTVTSDVFKYEFDLGLSVLLSEHVSFDVVLAYSNAKEDLPLFDAEENPVTMEITTSSIGLNLGFSVFLGK